MAQTILWLEFCLTDWANQGPSSKIMSLQKFRMTSLFCIICSSWYLISLFTLHYHTIRFASFLLKLTPHIANLSPIPIPSYEIAFYQSGGHSPYTFNTLRHPPRIVDLRPYRVIANSVGIVEHSRL